MLISKNQQRLFGIVILLLCYGFIVNRLIQFQNWHEFKEVISKSSKWILRLLVIQSILVIANLLVESKKWQILLSNILKVKLYKSFKMVLSGYSSGIFTPGKIGEPIGRLLWTPKELWGQGAVLNYYGGLIHNIVIFIVGVSCTIFLWTQTNYTSLLKLTMYLIAILVFFILITCSVWLFRNYINALLKSFKFYSKLVDKLVVLKTISTSETLQITLLSFIRFLIYSFQLFLFFWGFGSSTIELSFFILIPVYFMSITLIPSFLLADIGVRSSVALLLFTKLHIAEPTILLAVFMTWIVNQVVPATVGSLLFLKKNL